MKTHLGCQDLIHAGVPSNCCDSCHDDWEEYDMEMFYLEDSALPDVEAHICCGTARAIDSIDEPLADLLSRAIALKIQRETHP